MLPYTAQTLECAYLVCEAPKNICVSIGDGGLGATR